MMKGIERNGAEKKSREQHCPGAIKTTINAVANCGRRSGVVEVIPEGRVGGTEDSSRAAVWLASDASDYVTGTTLFVDGGMTLYPGFATGG